MRRTHRALLFFFASLTLLIVGIYLHEYCIFSLDVIVWDLLFLAPTLLIALLASSTKHPGSSLGAAIFSVAMIHLISDSPCRPQASGGASMIEVAWLILSAPVSIIGVSLFYWAFGLLISDSIEL